MEQNISDTHKKARFYIKKMIRMLELRRKSWRNIAPKKYRFIKLLYITQEERKFLFL